jgi:hypothetical protein
MITNKELLFNLIKKLDSKEIKLDFDGEKVYLNKVVIGELDGHGECSTCHSPQSYNDE